MSIESDPLVDFIKGINPIDAQQAVHASQQILRTLDAEFVRRLLPLVLKTHPETLSPRQATLHRTILIDALRKLAAANAELIAMAEASYNDRLHLQTMTALHPKYRSLQPYGLGHCALAGGSHSNEGT